MAGKSLLLGTLAAGAAVLAISTITVAQVSRTIAVSVLSTSGTPVVNATVCIGTSSDRAALGGGRTNASGTATLTIPAETSGSLLVTGGTGSAGTAATVPGALGLVTLRLPASGGPACPATTQRGAVPGQFAVSQSAIDRARASATARPIGQTIGPINLGHRCLGAAGQNCNDVPPELGTCDPLVSKTCGINAGSWQHDECCVRNPQGGMCDNNPAEFLTQTLPGGSQVCQTEFNLAVARLETPFTWRRKIDMSVRNTTSVVDHAAYCAPAGTPVDIGLGESRFCCSRLVRGPRPAELLQFDARALAAVPAARIGICT